MNVLLSTLLIQRERWILWAPVPLALGIGIYFGLHREPPLWAGPAALVVLALGFLPLYKNKAAVLAWAAVFLIALGFAAGQARTWSLDTATLHKKTKPLELRGRVVGVDAMEKAYRVTLDNLSFNETTQERMPQSARIRLKKSDAARPREGDEVAVRAVLLPLSAPVLPGAFDFQRHGWFKGLGATGFAISGLQVLAPRKEGFFFERLRQDIRARVHGAGLAAPNISALAVAFMTGDSSGITEKDWDIARRSGIAHLIAISGSHFVMIVGVMFFAVRALLAAFPYIALRWPVKKISAGAAMFAAVFYMLLIGAPIPAQRAALMSCMIMLAIMLDRDPLTLRLAALAAFVVLLLEPESLMGASFQLSFSAVVGMIAFFESTRGWWSRHYREGGFFRKVGLVLLSCFMTTAIATVATTPFVLYHFLRAPFFSGLVANMIAVPLSSFITFPAALLSCLMMPLGLEEGPLWITLKSIEVIMQTAEAVANWPNMVIHANAWPAWCLALIAFGGLWACLWQGWIRWLGLAPAALALAAAILAPRPDVLVGGANFRLLAAVRAEDGRLLLSPGKFEGFVRKAWVEREGRRGSGAWPEEFCGERTCLVEIKGFKILFNKQMDFRSKPGEEMDLKLLEQDCAAADIIILPGAKRPKFRCNATIIDKWDLYDDGAHAIYLRENSAPRIISVTDKRGIRPWTGRRYEKYTRWKSRGSKAGL